MSVAPTSPPSPTPGPHARTPSASQPAGADAAPPARSVGVSFPLLRNE